MFAAEALRRGGAKRLVLRRAVSLLHAAGHGFPRGRSDQPEGHRSRCSRGCVIASITVDAHLHRTPDIRTVFPGIESDNLSAMPAICRALRKAGLDPRTVVAGPDAESLPWVSDLAGRLGLSHTVAQKTRRGDRSVAIEFQDPALHCRPSRPDRRRHRLIRRHHDRLRRGADRRRRDAIDAVVTHALFPEAVCRDI